MSKPTLTRDRYGFVRGWVIVVTTVVAILALIATALPLVRYLDHRGMVNKCNALEQVLGQDTQVVNYTYWNYQCLTEVDGQLIDASDYVQMTQVRLLEVEG